MKTIERFNRAISALVTAFFEETLAKGTCAACAVGNMVAAGYGVKVNKDFSCSVDNGQWYYALPPRWVTFRDEDLVKDNIDSTGYSIEELALVEDAFESNTSILHTDYTLYSRQEIVEDQYKGLMAVVDVLCKIEGIEDAKEYKEMFEFSR